MFSVKKPYYGAAYYPEAWPESEMDRDIAGMQAAGMNVMRMGEFAWAKMEPREGVYDFSLFIRAARKLKEAGIAFVMGTPTCTPPAWMTTAYPEIMKISIDGIRATHGARQNCCVNNPQYLALCDRIVTELAKAFADGTEAAENLVGWQIDNELYPTGPDAYGCCCPHCTAQFREWLRKRYGTIEQLNESWGTDVWSLHYDSFEQIPAPVRSIWHHPAYRTDWQRFKTDAYAAFAARQAAILHRYSKAPVGTDMMPLYGLDFVQTTEHLDVAQLTEYRDCKTMSDLPMWFSYLKNLKNKPFWTVETAASWGGNTFRAWLNEPEFCVANSWLPVAMGSDSMLYWLWRCHRGGQELEHGSVVTAWGRPSHVFPEIQRIAAGFEKARGVLNGTFPERYPLAMHLSSDAARTLGFQPITRDFDYSAKLTESYIALREAQLNPEMLDPAGDLTPYKVIFSPYLPCLEHKGLKDRLYRWIQDGGIWIAGPFTDIRTPEEAHYKTAPYGFLEDWADVQCAFSLPDGKTFRAELADGTGSFAGSVNYDALTCKERAKPWAVYREAGFLQGYCAVTETAVGDRGGKIYVMGTMPRPENLPAVIGRILREAGVSPVAEASPNVVAVPRSGASGEKVLFAVEIKNEPGSLTAPWDGTDLLSGRSYKAGTEIALAPFGVAALVPEDGEKPGKNA